MHHSLFCALLLLLPGTAPAEDLPPGSPGRVGPLPAASRASLQDHEARPWIFADPDWCHWCGSVIRGEDGRYHMFYSRWPRDNGRAMRGWLYVSEIAHAVADRPEGPYRAVGTVLEGFGEPQQDRWDAFNAHNPSITRLIDPATGRPRYYLYFIANRDDDRFSRNGHEDDWVDRVINQRIGVAWADSLDGPWTRHPDPIIPLALEDGRPNGLVNHYVVNPGVAALPDGRYLMVLKTRSPAVDDNGKPSGPMVHVWALADSPTGPFLAQSTPLFPADIHAEDPCVWVRGDWIFAAVKDWNGQLSGQTGIGYVRGRYRNGTIAWEIPEQANITPRVIRWDDGQSTRVHAVERPCILLDAEGNPTHLFVACSVANEFGSNWAQPDPHLPFNLCLPLVREE